MARAFCACFVFAALPIATYSENAPKPSETVIKLVLSPAAAPRPALKYMLLPDLKETSPGNPVHGYLKCLMEQQHFFFDNRPKSIGTNG